MFFRVLILILLPLIPWASAVSRPPATELLRRMADLPDIHEDPVFSFNPRTGFSWMAPWERLDWDESAEPPPPKSGLAALHQLELAWYFELNGQVLVSQRLFRTSWDQARKNLETQPMSAEWLQVSSQALRGLQRYDEAESTARDWLSQAPDSALANLTLAEILAEKTWVTLRPYPSLVSQNLITPIQPIAPSGRYAEQGVAALMRWMEEASRRLNLAREKAPEEANYFYRLGLAQFTQSWIQELLANPFSPETLLKKSNRHFALLSQDWGKASDLDKENLFYLGSLLWAEIFQSLPGADQFPTLLAQRNLWREISHSSRERIRTALSRLESFEEGENSTKAAASLELGASFARLLFNDLPKAESLYSRSLEKDLSRQKAWFSLAEILLSQGRYSQVQSLAENRLLQGDMDTKTKIFLAQSLAYQDYTSEAEEILRGVLRVEPTHFWANLTLASLVLKTGDVENLQEARETLVRAERNADIKPRSRPFTELHLRKGIYFALEDEPDKARQIFKRLLDLEKDQPMAREALSILGY